MLLNKLMESKGEIPVFPYRIVWEEIDAEPTTFAYLLENAEENEILADNGPILHPDAPTFKKGEVQTLVSSLNLEHKSAGRLEERLALIGRYYLAYKIKQLLELDLFSSRETLRKAADAASKLDEAMSRIPPKAAAVLEFVKAVEPGVIDPEAPFLKLGQTSHDFALVAKRIFDETAPKKTGRRNQFVRDGAIRLTIEALTEAGLESLVISKGTKRNSGWHFGGDLGLALRDYFILIEPGISEPSLAPIVAKVRRNNRKSPGTNS